MIRTSFSKHVERAVELFELIHSDVCSPGTNDRFGLLYFITFIYDYSQYGYVYLMKLSLKLLGDLKTLRIR